MNVSIERRTSLMLLRHVGRRPAPGAKTDRDVQVMAAKGHLYFFNRHPTVGCEALVLVPGAFWIRRALLERVPRSFGEKEVIILELDRRQLTIGGFRNKEIAIIRRRTHSLGIPTSWGCNR